MGLVQLIIAGRDATGGKNFPHGGKPNQVLIGADFAKFRDAPRQARQRSNPQFYQLVLLAVAIH
jgi:hypothetical protein